MSVLAHPHIMQLHLAVPVQLSHSVIRIALVFVFLHFVFPHTHTKKMKTSAAT